MTERRLNMRGNITLDAENRMVELMEIPCVHSVTWHDKNNIEISYISEPTDQQKEQINKLIQ